MCKNKIDRKKWNAHWQKFVKGCKFICNANITKVVLVVLCILVLAMAAISVYYTGKIGSESIIIAFFGILATFIVVSNYSQVSDIKNETSRQIIQQSIRIADKEKILEDNIKMQIDDAKEKIKAIEQTVFTEADESRILSIQSQFETFKTENDKLKKGHDELVLLTAYLINGQHRDLLLSILQGKTYRCSVKLAGKTYLTNAFQQNNAVYFNIKNLGLISDVEHVNGIEYNSKTMVNYLRIFNSMQ